jgi:hypothetical protein
MALWALSASRQMASFKAGPKDVATHGTLLADLQINMAGWLLGAFSGVMAAICLALLVGLALGVSGALYFATFLAMFGVWLFVKVGFGIGWFGIVLFLSLTLVIGSALAHWFRSREPGKSV